jgi:hypothetical protein
MSKFIISIWFFWIMQLTFKSIITTTIIILSIITTVYFIKGRPELHHDTLLALFDVGLFFLPIVISIVFLILFIITIPSLFNRTYNKYQLIFKNCKNEIVVDLLLKHRLKVWRFWLFGTIWAIAVQITIIGTIRYFLNLHLVNWISLYWFYIMFLIASLITLPLLIHRLKFLKLINSSDLI